MLESNVIICKTPNNNGLSNLLSMPADMYQSAQFYMDFNKINSVDEIIERFDWMESRGYHLRNDRGWVYRSINIAEVIENLRMNANIYREVNSDMTRYLTRSGNLRNRVVELLNDELDETIMEEVSDE